MGCRAKTWVVLDTTGSDCGLPYAQYSMRSALSGMWYTEIICYQLSKKKMSVHSLPPCLDLIITGRHWDKPVILLCIMHMHWYTLTLDQDGHTVRWGGKSIPGGEHRSRDLGFYSKIDGIFWEMLTIGKATWNSLAPESVGDRRKNTASSVPVGVWKLEKWPTS